MRTLKMLPWLARRAGIADSRAKELWVDSIRYATANSAWIGTSDYWGTAVRRLLELIEAEERHLCALAVA